MGMSRPALIALLTFVFVDAVQFDKLSLKGSRESREADVLASPWTSGKAQAPSRHASQGRISALQVEASQNQSFPDLKEMAETGMKWLTGGLYHTSEAVATGNRREDLEERREGDVEMESTRRRKVAGASDPPPEPAWNDMGLGPNANTAPILGSDFGLDYVNWSLCNVSYHSNLAGVGPDAGEESIRYYNVATASGGQSLDLVVTANGSYAASDINVNGLVSGDSCFGVVNLRSLPSGYNSVELLFSMYLGGTNTSVAMEKFFLTVFDFDSSTTATEHVTFYNRVTNLYYVPDHDMNISGDLDSVGLTFTSTIVGTGEDNPTDPFNLTDLQKRRAVMVSYEEKTQWKYTFAVSGGKVGRNFAFAGRSNLPLASSTTTTTSPKTSTTASGGGDVTPAPTPAPPCEETQSCQIWADPHVSGFDNNENQGPEYFKLLRESGADSKEQTRSTFGMHTFDGRPVDVDAYDSGDFWLVKSEPVHIQARFRRSGEFIPDHAAVGALAVGGPFLKNRVLVVEALDGQVTFDGMSMPRGTWRGVEGDVIVRRLGNDVDAELPMGVKLNLKRFDKHIDVQITMPKIEGGVDGECGNYDGIAENDEESNVEERMGDLKIDDSLLLLPKEDGSAVANNVVFTEEDYQAIAALHSDVAMSQFIKHVLAAEGKFVPEDQEGELQGLVPWFSGTIATQSLREMILELFSKSWVKDLA